MSEFAAPQRKARKRPDEESSAQVQPASAPPGPGRPLYADLRTSMEARFGHDFSQVRVHDDHESAAAADNLGAAAYTTGSDIVFGAGRYQPDTATGRRLLAHELTHVVQQAGGTRATQSKAADPSVTAPGDRSEQAADTAAEAVLSGRSPAPPAPVAASTVQRDSGRAATEVMASRVVDGDDHYRYEQFADGAIVIVAGPARVGERHAKGDRVNQAITAEIERKYGPFPTAAAAPEADLPPPGGGDLLPSLDTILTTARDSGVALIDDLTGLVRSALAMVGGTTAAPASAVAAGPAASGTGVDANLAEAKKLADELTIGHSYDHDGRGKHGADETVIADELQGGARRDAIIGGKADQLQTILCSEFTNLTLAKMGVDLTERYLVPGDRLPLGYPEKGKVTFLTLYMVTNNQTETTAALIDHQNKLSRRVTAGSKEAIGLGCQGEAGDFFVVDKKDLVGLAVGAGDEFGAGAAAVSQGGKAIDPADRKPGDLQQALAVDDSGRASGAGHSSQVWTVFGYGIARLGQPGSPAVAGGKVSAPGPIETLSGWYALPPGPLKWEVGPGTDPALVAKLTCVEVQLIEANIGNAGDDATGIGKTRADKATEVVSNGRLPGSKWITWRSRDQPVKGKLS